MEGEERPRTEGNRRGMLRRDNGRRGASED